MKKNQGNSAAGMKETPAYLKALGRKLLPAEIRVGQSTYRHARTYKNDFFAATALYEGESGRVVLKMGRQASFLFIPMAWVGRWLARREETLMTHLAGLDGIPDFLGRFGATGFVREYIEGHAMSKGEHVPDDFHARLRAVVTAVHARGAAYVDLEKCENVIVGADGRPYLCDFQIAWYVPPRWGGELWPLTSIRRWFQRGDCYHLLKLQRRTRPDQLSAEELALSYRKPWYVRVHAVVSRPLRSLRRWGLGFLDPRRKVGERGRVAD